MVLVTMNSCTGDTSGLKLYRQFFTHSFGAREDQALSNSTCDVKPSNATSLNIDEYCHATLNIHKHQMATGKRCGQVDAQFDFFLWLSPATSHASKNIWSYKFSAWRQQARFVQQLQNRSLLPVGFHNTHLLSHILNPQHGSTGWTTSRVTRIHQGTMEPSP